MNQATRDTATAHEHDDNERTEPYRMTAAEHERLAYFTEECAEAIAAGCKAQRHGYESVNPIHPGADNRRLLETEIADVKFAIRMLERTGDIDHNVIEAMVAEKPEYARRWFHHQEAFFETEKTHTHNIKGRAIVAAIAQWSKAHRTLGDTDECTLDGFEESFSEAESLFDAVRGRCLRQEIQSDWTTLGDATAPHHYRAVMREHEPFVAIVGMLGEAALQHPQYPQSAAVVIGEGVRTQRYLTLSAEEGVAITWYAQLLEWGR